MDRIKQPSKEHVREWLMERQSTHTPPPDAAQIRRELGWTSTDGARKADEVSQCLDHMDHIDRARQSTYSLNGAAT